MSRLTELQVIFNLKISNKYLILRIDLSSKYFFKLWKRLSQYKRQSYFILEAHILPNFEVI